VTLRTQTDHLTPEQRQRLHADFLANEQSYLQMRDSLLAQYRGMWVAVHGGRVVAAGPDVLQVTGAAAAHGGHPYIARVGEEESAVFRVRRATFACDQAYSPFALPRLTATFLNYAETHSQTYADVVADTGADLTLLPDRDCSAFDLFSSPYLTGITSGVYGAGITALFYRAKAEVAGRHYAALIQPVAGATERIMGRDVLNQLRALFDGPAGEVVIDP
jgi:hypothetical protein